MRFIIPAALVFGITACSQADTPDTTPDTKDTPDQAVTYAPKIITPDNRKVVPFPGHDTAFLTQMGDTQAGLSISELTLNPKSLGAPPHQHADEDEYFVVLSGSVSFLNGKETVTAGPGAIAILPRGHWHGFWNASDAPAQLLMIIAPGHFETFFDEVVITIRQENADNPARIGAIIAQTAAKRNVTVDMSKLPPEAAALLGPPPQE